MSRGVPPQRGLRLVSASRAGYGSSSRRPGRSVAGGRHRGGGRGRAPGRAGGGRRPACWAGPVAGPHALACVAVGAGPVPGGGDRSVGVAPYPAEGHRLVRGHGAGERGGVPWPRWPIPENSVRSAERDWPAVALGCHRAGDRRSQFGGLIDDVDRGSLTGEFAEFVAAGRAARGCARATGAGWTTTGRSPGSWGFDLAAIGAPVHVWQGGHDKMVPFGHGAGAACRHIPSACRHLPPRARAPDPGRGLGRPHLRRALRRLVLCSCSNQIRLNVHDVDQSASSSVVRAGSGGLRGRLARVMDQMSTLWPGKPPERAFGREMRPLCTRRGHSGRIDELFAD